MQTFIKVAAGILSALLVIWLITVWWNYVPDHSNDRYISNSKLDSMNAEIESLKISKDNLTDSLFGMQVEKGHIEVELNKSQSELKRLMAGSKAYHLKRDTIAIVQNCDSIIAELENRYLPTNDTLRIVQWAIDSIVNVEGKFIDSIFRVVYAYKVKTSAELNVCQTNNNELRTENDELRKSLRKKPKVTLWVGIGGFVAGLLTAISIIR